MKFPVYIHVGNTDILLHTLIEPIAFFVGFRYFLFLKKKHGEIIQESNRIWILIAAIFGALAGSRILGALEDPDALLKSEHMLLYVYSNKTVLGGFLGGLWAVEIVKKILGEKKASGDLFVFPIILALIIGRIGCFTMGVKEETYGLPTRMFTGMDLGDGLFRHPVTLYEILFLGILWVILFYSSKHLNLQNGSLFKIFMIAYISFRFLLDFLKPHFTWSIGLSTIQLACFFGMLWYSLYIIKPKRLLQPINNPHA